MRRLDVDEIGINTAADGVKAKRAAAELLGRGMEIINAAQDPDMRDVGISYRYRYDA